MPPKRKHCLTPDVEYLKKTKNTTQPYQYCTIGCGDDFISSQFFTISVPWNLGDFNTIEKRDYSFKSKNASKMKVYYTSRFHYHCELITEMLQSIARDMAKENKESARIAEQISSWSATIRTRFEKICEGEDQTPCTSRSVERNDCLAESLSVSIVQFGVDFPTAELLIVNHGDEQLGEGATYRIVVDGGATSFKVLFTTSSHKVAFIVSELLKSIQKGVNDSIERTVGENKTSGSPEETANRSFESISPELGCICPKGESLSKDLGTSRSRISSEVFSNLGSLSDIDEKPTSQEVAETTPKNVSAGENDVETASVKEPQVWAYEGQEKTVLENGNEQELVGNLERQESTGSATDSIVGSGFQDNVKEPSPASETLLSKSATPERNHHQENSSEKLNEDSASSSLMSGASFESQESVDKLLKSSPSQVSSSPVVEQNQEPVAEEAASSVFHHNFVFTAPNEASKPILKTDEQAEEKVETGLQRRKMTVFMKKVKEEPTEQVSFVHGLSYSLQRQVARKMKFQYANDVVQFVPFEQISRFHPVHSQYGRVFGIKIEGMIFTNLSHDDALYEFNGLMPTFTNDGVVDDDLSIEYMKFYLTDKWVAMQR